MGFFSSQMTQFMQVLVSERHAVLGAHVLNLLLFRAAMTHVVAFSPRLDGTFMASQSILFEMELFF